MLDMRFYFRLTNAPWCCNCSGVNVLSGNLGIERPTTVLVKCNSSEKRPGQCRKDPGSDVQSLRTDEAVGGQHEESLLCFKVTETDQTEARCIFLATYLISKGEQNNSVYLHCNLYSEFHRSRTQNAFRS